MKQYVEINYKKINKNRNYEELINKVIKNCFEVEKLINTNLYVSVILTTPDNIRQINKKYRNIDKETDVLSFPMFEKEEIDNIKNNNVGVDAQIDPIQNINYIDPLGDIIISIPKVEEQAKEYGHSFERELAYMLVHGFYHLMGEDHIEEKDKEQMRKKEENVLNQLNILRE